MVLVLDADKRRTFLDKRSKSSSLLCRLPVQCVALPVSLVEPRPAYIPPGRRPGFCRCVTRGDLIHMELFRAAGHFREIVPTIAERPDEESRFGRLADFKWSSLRI